MQIMNLTLKGCSLIPPARAGGSIAVMIIWTNFLHLHVTAKMITTSISQEKERNGQGEK